MESLQSLLHTKKALYVEDDKDVRMQTSKLLRLYFQEVVEASDGKEALKIFKEHSFDIVFTDINMPKVDGLSMIETIRSLNQDIIIIVFSAYDNTEYFLRTIQQNVFGYLLKPFLHKDLLSLLLKTAKYWTQHSGSLCYFSEGFVWDKSSQTLYNDNETQNLTKKELALFDLLSSSKEHIFSSEEIEISVFDDNFSDNKRVRNLLFRLRQKLSHNIIQSIYNQGYKLLWKH